MYIRYSVSDFDLPYPGLFPYLDLFTYPIFFISCFLYPVFLYPGFLQVFTQYLILGLSYLSLFPYPGLSKFPGLFPYPIK